MKYLDWLKKLNVIPNFWCAEEYFEKAGLEEELFLNDFLIVKEKGTGQVMFPAVDTIFGVIGTGGLPRIWSDFEGWGQPIYGHPNGYTPSFLDYEYIYNTKEFLTMEGGKWQTFRKNCRKFPKRHSKILNYFPVEGNQYSEGIKNLVIRWLESKDETIEDDEIMMKYVFEGKNRWVLTDEDGVVLGLNIFDFNYLYINFRFSFHIPREDFLAEYLRYVFYTSSVIQQTNKRVNDGGVLDNLNLKKFKDKMNPISIRSVFSWVRKDLT